MSARAVSVPMPLLGMIAGTRVAGGVGLGFLLAERFERRRRRVIGSILLAVGALTTIPLVATVMLRNRRAEAAAHTEEASLGGRATVGTA